ncbi:MAG: Crp/Fnr family transcriptional regulator, partial [Myxococcales bacterium]
VRIFGVAGSGKEALLTLVEPPTWFGEISVFDGLPRTHDAVAEGEAKVLHVPQRAVDALLEREPRWWRDIGLLLTAKLRLAFVTLEDSTLLPTSVRLARRLVWMADGYGEWLDRHRRVLKVRQEQLAMMLAVSRQTTNQLLKELEADGLVKVSYGGIELLDLERIREVAARET